MAKQRRAAGGLAGDPPSPESATALLQVLLCIGGVKEKNVFVQLIIMPMAGIKVYNRKRKTIMSGVSAGGLPCSWETEKGKLLA